MDSTTKNSRKVRKVREGTSRIEAVSTLPDNSISTVPRPAPNHYDLRNGKTFIIRPSSKSVSILNIIVISLKVIYLLHTFVQAEEQNHPIKCPPLSHKIQRNLCLNNNHLRSYGARALGKKGTSLPLSWF